MYDPKSEVTVKGTVQDVQQQTGKNGWSGTHLTLKADAGTFDVHVDRHPTLLKSNFPSLRVTKLRWLGRKSQSAASKHCWLARSQKMGKLSSCAMPKVFQSGLEADDRKRLTLAKARELFGAAPR